MNKEKLIEYWKNNNIDRAEFEFSCGGDSMNDYSITFYDKDNNEIDIKEEIKSDFIDLIFDNVVFYEISDGYYLGEYGTVDIYFDEEANDFDITKNSTAEYSENLNRELQVELNEEEAEYFKNYISNIELTNDGINAISYFKDFIKYDRLTEIEESIINKVYEIAEIVEDDIRLTEQYQNYFECRDFVLTENLLKFTVLYSIIVREE